MKSKFTLAILSTAALALSACGDRRANDDLVRTTPESEISRESREAINATERAAREGARDVSRATSNAYADARDAMRDGLGELQRATFDERADFRDRLSERVSDMDEELAELREDGRNLSADAQRKLADARQEFNQKLTRLSNATRDNWEEVKAETAKAWSELQLTFQETKAQVQAAE
jgi:hypothetical protein